MKNKVDWNLTETWLGKSLIKVRQKVDEVWMGIGQYLVRSWSTFKANEVGQNLDKSWTDFHPFRICQGYTNGMPEFRSKRLLQFFSNTSPEMLTPQLPHAYPENKDFSLEVSGRNQDKIGIENCGKVAVWFQYPQGFEVVQFLGEIGVDLGPFYLEMNLIIQPPSFITLSLIADNKRAQDKWLDVPELFLYVVLPDQNL